MATIDLNLFEVFAQVAETSSFSEAAKRLGVPKSSVSRAIARLESEMKMRLLNRTTRQVALSTAGIELHNRIAPQLEALKSAVCGMPELEAEPRGLLRVTASPDFGAAVLAELVTRFVETYPAIQVDLRLTNAQLDLVADGIDVALRVSGQALKDSSFTARQIMPISIHLYASPKYVAKNKPLKTPRDLEKHTWIAFRQIPQLTLLAKDDVFSFRGKSQITCDDMEFLRVLAKCGAGICALPTFLGDADVKKGELVRVLPKWEIPRGNIWFLSPAGRNPPRKVAVFRDFLVESLNAKSRTGKRA